MRNFSKSGNLTLSIREDKLVQTDGHNHEDLWHIDYIEGDWVLWRNDESRYRGILHRCGLDVTNNSSSNHETCSCGEKVPPRIKFFMKMIS